MPGGAFDEAAFWMVVGLNRVGTDAPDIHIGDDGYDGDDGDDENDASSKPSRTNKSQRMSYSVNDG